MGTLVTGVGGVGHRSEGGGEISDSNYSDQPLEAVIGLSFSPGTILDNETNESTFGPVKDDLFPDYPAQLTNLTAIVCVLFFVFGIPGNIITIIALAKCKKVVEHGKLVGKLLLTLLVLSGLELTGIIHVTNPMFGIEMFGLVQLEIWSMGLETMLRETFRRKVLGTRPRLQRSRQVHYGTKRLYVRNATAYFIINLSACDLIFCCFNLPLTSSMFWHRKWIHGDTLCRLFPFFRYGLMAVSVFTVLAITINRYVMIGHPRVYPRFYRTRNLGLMIFFIWLGAFGALFPTLLGAWGKFELDREIGSCSIMPDENDRSPKEFLFIFAFVLPCISIIICYARIFFIVRKATVNSRPVEPTASSLNTNHHQPLQETETLASDQAIMRRGSARPSMAMIHQRGKMTAKDRKLLWMILVIFGSFVICYLPITILKAVKNRSPELNVFGLLLIYLTTWSNPLIYVVMSSEYRQAYKSLMLCRKDWNLSSRTSNSNKT